MNGHQYEHHAAKYLKRHGFHSVKVTKASGDYGADIIARKRGRRYAVQCKYYSSPVGIHAVQEVVAAKKHYRCSRAIVITNHSFTKPARTLAQENNVELIEGVKPFFRKRSARFSIVDSEINIAAYFTALGILCIAAVALILKLMNR